MRVLNRARSSEDNQQKNQPSRPGACPRGVSVSSAFHWPETCGKHQEGPLLPPPRGRPGQTRTADRGKARPCRNRKRPCSIRPAVCSTPVPARWNTQHVESKSVFKFVPLFHLKTTLLYIFRMAGKSPGACSRGVFVSSASTGRRRAKGIRKGRSCPRRIATTARREQRTGESPPMPEQKTPLFISYRHGKNIGIRFTRFHAISRAAFMSKNNG